MLHWPPLLSLAMAWCNLPHTSCTSVSPGPLCSVWQNSINRLCVRKGFYVDQNVNGTWYKSFCLTPALQWHLLGSLKFNTLWGEETTGKWLEAQALSLYALATVLLDHKIPSGSLEKTKTEIQPQIHSTSPQIIITLTILPTQPCHSCDTNCGLWLDLYEYRVLEERRRWKEGSWGNSAWNGPWWSASHTHSASRKRKTWGSDASASSHYPGLLAGCMAELPVVQPTPNPAHLLTHWEESTHLSPETHSK